MDLINKLGAKQSAEGAGSPEPSQESRGASVSVNKVAVDAATEVGLDLTRKASKSATAATDQTTVESKAPEKGFTKEEPSKPESVLGDDWTVESALKEVKKLREENKATRIKYAESIQQLKSEADSKIVQREQELQDLIKAKDELELIKAKEEDRKRDLSEKLAHREALVSEYKSKLELEKKAAEDRMNQIQSELQRYKAEAEAQMVVYQDRLKSELGVIPEKFKDVAELIVRGAGDPRDALVALNEAKLKGLFDDKTVVVSHSVPGALDGARASKEKLDEAAKAARDKMTSGDKIKAALREIRSGSPNSAFKTRQ